MEDINALADTLARFNAEKIKSPDIIFGTVKGISAKMLDVLIDGASATSKVARACNPVVGDRVVIAKNETIWLAIAVVGGSYDVVWTAPAGQSTFLAQTIPLNLTGYRYVKIFLTGNSLSAIDMQIPSDAWANAFMPQYGLDGSGNFIGPLYFVARFFSVSRTGISVGVGHGGWGTATTFSIRNDNACPTMIIAYK